MARDDAPLGTRAEFDPSANEPGNVGADEFLDHEAPLNRVDGDRVHMRTAVDHFRNERVTVPATLDEAFEALALSLELYETAREAERIAHEAHAAHTDAEPETRERAQRYLLDADDKSKVSAEARENALNITGGRSASSVTAADKLVDLVPFVAAFNAEARRLHRAKLDAEKETSVARRRHDTAKIFAERFQAVTTVRIAPPYLGDVQIDGRRMTADEVRDVVRDTAARRGGFTAYPPLRNGESLTLTSEHTLDGDAQPAPAAPAPESAP
jgi:hypothetical protein